MDGIDLYTAYQTVEDFAAVRRSGRSFAYFKGTDGMTTKNTSDWPARAHAAGIACGLYGYAQPGSAVDQYDLLLRTARDRGAIDLAPALDLEAPFVPGAIATQFATAWLARAVSAGQLPVFYANDSMMSYLLPTVRAAVPSVWPWIARYGAAPKNPYRTWQHSSTGKVPGILASAVDLDTGEAPYAGQAPAPVTPPTPGARLAVANMEEFLMDPIIHAPVPKVTNPDGTVSQKSSNMIVWTGAAAVLNVQPLGNDMVFFGAGEAPGPPVWCYGPGGGKGGGSTTVPLASYDQGNQRRLLRNQPGQYEIPAGTTAVYYEWSSNGRVAVQVVPKYLLG